MAHNQQEDLRLYQEEISNVLSEQIVARYYLTKGEIANALTHDPDVKKAIEILNDEPSYRKLLSPNQ